jgi:tRNA A37 methylthiotransferase MiaB
MANQVPTKIKEERVAVLRKLDHKKRMAFYKSRIGQVHPVLVETAAVEGLAKGFTDNYIPVHFKARPNGANRVVPVKLESVEERFVIGTPL